MELGQLLSDGHADAKVEWNGHVVGFVFDTNAFTPKLEGDVRRAAANDDENQSRAICDALAGILVEWDVTKDGEPFAPTGDNLMTLPLGFLMKMFQAITAEMTEDPLSTGTSGAP